jgi:hypothetical protein
LRAEPVMACGEQGIGAGECENGQAEQTNENPPPRSSSGKRLPALKNSATVSL